MRLAVLGRRAALAGFGYGGEPSCGGRELLAVPGIGGVRGVERRSILLPAQPELLVGQ